MTSDTVTVTLDKDCAKWLRDKLGEQANKAALKASNPEKTEEYREFWNARMTYWDSQFDAVDKALGD